MCMCDVIRAQYPPTLYILCTHRCNKCPFYIIWMCRTILKIAKRMFTQLDACRTIKNKTHTQTLGKSADQLLSGRPQNIYSYTHTSNNIQNSEWLSHVRVHRTSHTDRFYFFLYSHATLYASRAAQVPNKLQTLIRLSVYISHESNKIVIDYTHLLVVRARQRSIDFIAANKCENIGVCVARLYMHAALKYIRTFLKEGRYFDGAGLCYIICAIRRMGAKCNGDDAILIQPKIGCRASVIGNLFCFPFLLARARAAEQLHFWFAQIK